VSSCGHTYRYIRSSTVVTVPCQYHTPPVTHQFTLICIHQVAHVHEMPSRPEQAPLLPFLNHHPYPHMVCSLVLFHPHPLLVEKECREKMKRNHELQAAKLSQHPLTYSLFSKQPSIITPLSPDCPRIHTQPLLTPHSHHFPPLVVLDAIHLLGRFLVGTPLTI